MEWTVTKDRDNASDWRVEGIAFKDEGKVYVTIFSGPDAQARAEEYAQWQQSLQLESRAA